MLGDVALHRDGPDGDCCLKNSRTLAILAWLAITPRHAVPRDYLATLMWPDSGARARRRSLRQALYYLKQQGVGRLLQIDDDTVALRSELLETDVDLFEDHISDGDFRAAIDLYGGPFLEGLRGSISGEMRQWMDARDERLRVAFRVAATRGIEDALEGGDTDTAIALSTRYVDSDPLDGRARRLHVRSLVADGRNAEALMAYEEYATLLRAALEDRPEAELDALIAPVRGEIFGPLDTAPGAAGLWDERVEDDAADRDEDAGETSWSRYAIPALALLGAAVTLALALPRMTQSPPDVAGYLTVRFAGDTAWQRVAVRDGRLEPVDTRDTSLRHTQRSVPLPDRSGIAFWSATARGYDVYFRPAGDTDSIAVSTTPHEEHALDWSPDGRVLLYDRGRVSPDARAAAYELWAWDRAADEHRLVFSGWEGRNLAAHWSPDGGHVAARAHGRVELLRPDGTDRRTIYEGEQLRGLSWAPDGRRIALAYDDDGSSVLEIVSARDGDGRRIATTYGRFSQPAWLDDSLLVVLHDPGVADSVRLESIDPITEQREPLVGGAGIVDIDHEWTERTGDRWLDSVTVSVPSAPLPGVPTPLHARTTWSDGAEADIPASELTWRILGDAPHASFTSPGILLLSDTGAVRVEAGFPGWRTDTVVVEARPLSARAVEPAFVEDWTDGTPEDRWEPLGRPTPFTLAEGGPENGGVFVGHGDENFHSGAVTRRTFETDEGLTVEAWGRMPALDRAHLDFGLALAEPGDGGPGSGISRELFERAHVVFSMVGEFRHSQLTAGDSERDVVWPAPDGEWHLYALQVTPDGDVLLVVDGQARARIPDGLPDEFAGTPVAVGLYARSASHDDVHVQHGVVRVYEGVRYGVGAP